MTSDFDLFSRLSPLPAEDRESAIEAHPDKEQAQRIRRLFARDADTAFLSAMIVDGGASTSGGPGGSGVLGAGMRVRPEGYVVERLIGRGGSGLVYAALEEGSGRRVAIKVLREEHADEAAVELFRREARVLGRLKHPSIVGVHAVGWTGSGGLRRPFIVMELVAEAKPISEALSEGSSEEDFIQFAAVTAEAAEALHAAHEAGVIHRDLKPSNVLLGGDGRVKVIDFGVADLVATTQRTLTNTTGSSSLLGTLGYLSPERLRGREATVADDVYAFGVTMHECLSGRHPYFDETLDVLRFAEAVREGRLRSGAGPRPNVPTGLVRIARRAAAPGAGERYRSMKELGEDLRRFERGDPVLADSGRAMRVIRGSLRRRRVRVAAALATAAVLAGGATFVLSPKPGPTGPFAATTAIGPASDGNGRTERLVVRDASGEDVASLEPPLAGASFANAKVALDPGAPHGASAVAWMRYLPGLPGHVLVCVWPFGGGEPRFIGDDAFIDPDGREVPSERCWTIWTDVVEVFAESPGEEIVVATRALDGSASRLRVVSVRGEVLSEYWFPGDVVAARVWRRIDVGTPMPPRLLILGHDARIEADRPAAANSRSIAMSPTRRGAMVIAGLDLERPTVSREWLVSPGDRPGEIAGPTETPGVSVSDAEPGRARFAFYKRLLPAAFADAAYFPWDAFRFTGPDRSSLVRIRLHAFDEQPQSVLWEAYDILLAHDGTLRDATISDRAAAAGLPSPERLGFRLEDVLATGAMRVGGTAAPEDGDAD